MDVIQQGQSLAVLIRTWIYTMNAIWLYFNPIFHTVFSRRKLNLYVYESRKYKLETSGRRYIPLVNAEPIVGQYFLHDISCRTT